MKIAALDLGTNSFLCLIIEIERLNFQLRIKNIISDQVEIVRLGQGVQQNKKFHPEALARAEACLSRFKKTIDQHSPNHVLAMATSAARDVTNADELFQIGKKLEIPIEVIPGSQEAEITFYGSISGMLLNEEQNAVIDIGGGSTEIIIGNQDKIHFSQSADIGAVRITEMFFSQQPPSPEEFQKAKVYIQDKIQFLKQPVQQLNPQKIIAVAGTSTEIAKIIIGSFDREKIDGFKISLKDLESWQDKFLKSTVSERESLYGISPGRSDIILAGTMILNACLEIFGTKELIISTRGVRYGVALEIAKRYL